MLHTDWKEVRKGRVWNALERRGQEEEFSSLFETGRLFSFKLRLV